MEFRFFLNYNGTTIEVEEPIGFDGMKIQIQRDKVTHSATQEVSFDSLSFNSAGYRLIKGAFDTESTKAKVILTINYSCGSGWKELYKGNILFRAYEDVQGNTCLAKVVTGAVGVMDTVIANREKSVAIPVQSKITLPPKTIKAANFATIDSNKGGMYIGQKYSTYIVLPFDTAKVEYGDMLTIFNTYEDVDEVSPIYVAGNTNIDIVGSVGLQFNISNLYIDNFYGGAYPITKASVILRVNKDAEQILEEKHTLGNPSVSFHNTYNRSLSLAGGDRVYLYLKLEYKDRADRDLLMTLNAGTRVDITLNTKYAATPAYVSNLLDALKVLTDYCSEGQLSASSSLYSSNIRALTNGLHIRQAKMQNGANPSPFISMKSLLSSLTAIDNIGWGIEGNKMIFEKVRYFYKNNIVFSLSDIAKVTRKVNGEELYNRLLTGYKKWESEGANGLDAFCSKREYSTNEDTSKTLTQECDLLADSYAIEATRRKQLTETTDWKYDSDNFIICLKPDGTVEQGAIGENVVDPASIYNARISPARMAMRWFGVLMSFSRTPQGEVLRFGAADGNYVAKLGVSGGDHPDTVNLLAENADLTASMMEEDAWKPIVKAEILEFEYPLTVAEFELIRSNPLSLIECNGVLCWIRELEYRIFDGMTKFTMLPKF